MFLTLFLVSICSIDRWDFYQDYIQTVVELVKSKPEPVTGDKPDSDTSFESCHEFLCEVSHFSHYSKQKQFSQYVSLLPFNDSIKCAFCDFQLIEASNNKNRGPYMARLELYRVMTTNQFDAQKLLGEFIEMLIEYFRVFGEKPCCAKDIILFLDDLKDEQKPELASNLIQLCNISATTLPQSVR